MKKFNRQKENFLNKIPNLLIENEKDSLNNNIKFNFKYFDYSQPAGQDFKDWTHEQLYKFLNKLKEYSRYPISYWKNQSIGHGGNKVLEIYGSFPTKSDFFHPKHVPLDVNWARFRLEQDMRVIGFLIPNECKFDKIELDKTVFYIVFLDQYHKFYITKNK